MDRIPLRPSKREALAALSSVVLRRKRVSIYVEVDTTDDEQLRAFVARLMDAVLPVLAKTIRRTDQPTIQVDDVTPADEP